MHVCLVGPSSPHDLAELMFPRDAVLARSGSVGYRGLPVSTLAAALVAIGWQVTIVTTRPGDTYHWFQGPNFCLVQVPSRIRARDRAFDFFRIERERLVQAIDSVNADIIHAHWTYEFAMAALSIDRQSLVTAHDAPLTVLRHLPEPYRVARLVMAQIVARKVHNLTAVSPYLIEKFKRECLFPRTIKLVSNPVRHLPIARNSGGFSGRVTYVGSFDRRKNVKALLDAFEMFAESRAEAVLNLVGGFGEFSEFEEGVRSMPAFKAGMVLMHGQLGAAELGEVLARTDISVNPSLEETQSLTLLESMRVGIPCIGGNRSGAVPWTLEFGRAGLLVDVRKPHAIAEGLNQLADYPDYRSGIARRGLRLSEERAEPRRVAETYAGIYNQILGG